MTRFDFDATSLTRPHQWAIEDGASPFTHPFGKADSGFALAEISPHGMPALTRRGVDELEDARIRAFLDQPIVLYAHVTDGTGSLEAFARAARVLNRLPGLTWCSVGELAATNYRKLDRGGELYVEPFSRRLELVLAPETTTVTVKPLRTRSEATRSVETALPPDDAELTVLDDVETRVSVSASDMPRCVSLRLVAADRLDPAAFPSRRRRPRHALRRAAAEARDRTLPLVAATRRCSN
jgi:hypothetical protein